MVENSREGKGERQKANRNRDKYLREKMRGKVRAIQNKYENNPQRRKAKPWNRTNIKNYQ